MWFLPLHPENEATHKKVVLACFGDCGFCPCIQQMTNEATYKKVVWACFGDCVFLLHMACNLHPAYEATHKKRCFSSLWWLWLLLLHPANEATHKFQMKLPTNSKWSFPQISSRAESLPAAIRIWSLVDPSSHKHTHIHTHRWCKRSSPPPPPLTLNHAGRTIDSLGACFFLPCARICVCVCVCTHM